MLLQQFRRIYVRPKLLALTERHLKLHRVGPVAISCEHGHRVMEDVRATLDTLIEP